MRYCDNCGAELSEGAEFCDECGAKVEEWQQEIQNAELQYKHKKKSKIPVIIIILLLVICIVGVVGYFLYNSYSSKPKQTVKDAPSAKKESVIKEDNLLETVPWEKDSDETKNKVNKFRKNSLTDYPHVPLKTAYSNEVITVINEQYKRLMIQGITR